MRFVFLDEFGHIGPFSSRLHEKYNESPVFGLAGIILSEEHVRPFSTAFLQLKEQYFSEDIKQSGKISAVWEKTGSSIFTPKRVERYSGFKTLGFRTINLVRKHNGCIFYYGREKIKERNDQNYTGFYKTVFGYTIRKLNDYCENLDENFMIVVDQHSARADLLETAAKTMFGNEPARKLISPPFEAESHLNQNIQAADWLAQIIGRFWAYELEPDQYADHEVMKKYYWSRIHQLASHSSVFRRRENQPTLKFAIHPDPKTALGAAFSKAAKAKAGQ